MAIDLSLTHSSLSRKGSQLSPPPISSAAATDPTSVRSASSSSTRSKLLVYKTLQRDSTASKVREERERGYRENLMRNSRIGRKVYCKLRLAKNSSLHSASPMRRFLQKKSARMHRCSGRSVGPADKGFQIAVGHPAAGREKRCATAAEGVRRRRSPVSFAPSQVFNQVKGRAQI